MTAVRPPLVTLVGRFVALTPLRVDELVELHAAIGHPVTFAGGYGGGPAGYRADPAEFAEWARSYLPFGSSIPDAGDSSANNCNVYAVRLQGGAHDGLIVGTTTLGDFDLFNESAHIGWTAYDQRVWGSPVNAEAKMLLLGSAFEHGLGRVKLQADAMNTRSRAAIERLGAQYEGTLRRERRRADDTWRDTAYYSILADEWPAVRRGLQERLARHSEPVALPA